MTNIKENHCQDCPFQHNCMVYQCIPDSLFKFSKSELIKENQTIYQQEHLSSHLYFLCSGAVKLYRQFDKNATVTRDIRFKTHFLNLKSFVLDLPQHFSAKAISDSMVLTFMQPVIPALFQNQVTKRWLLNQLIYDFRNFELLTTHYQAQTSDERLKLALAKLYYRQKEARMDTPERIDLPRKELAHLISVTTETVVRKLKELESEGYIDIQARLIVVLPKLVRAMHSNILQFKQNPMLG
ncbi:MAG: Crp/Fnr family transcriptional regulator [Bacteroidota bacterium]